MSDGSFSIIYIVEHYTIPFFSFQSIRMSNLSICKPLSYLLYCLTLLQFNSNSNDQWSRQDMGVGYTHMYLYVSTFFSCCMLGPSRGSWPTAVRYPSFFHHHTPLTLIPHQLGNVKWILISVGLCYHTGIRGDVVQYFFIHFQKPSSCKDFIEI